MTQTLKRELRKKFEEILEQNNISPNDPAVTDVGLWRVGFAEILAIAALEIRGMALIAKSTEDYKAGVLGIDWALAGGVGSADIAAQNAEQNAERDLLMHYEHVMGYGTTLDWWGKDADMIALRKFLVTQTRENIETFAKWCKRPYSKFGPENAKRYPRDVMTFWPLAFGESQNTSGVEKPSTDGKGFYA